jgi:Rad3-related DNA helicase
MFNLEAIDDHFPKRVDGQASYREGQKKAIEFALNAFNSGKRVVLIEGPTGSGKSAIGMTLADMVPRSYYLTGSKILQDQLVGEFGDQIVELKGRNAYPCTFYPRFGPEMVRRGIWKQQQLDTHLKKNHNCADGFCKSKSGRQGKKQQCLKCFTPGGPHGTGRPSGDLEVLPLGMRYSACPYYEQVYKALAGRKVTMNFSSFLFQTQMTKRFDEPRDLMIVDECFHPHTRIQTEAGLIPIGKLVNEQMVIRVVSFNFMTKEIEYKPIARWLRRGKQQTYKVLVGNRTMYPTADHKIFTPYGKKKLIDLKVGDKVYVRQTEITPDQQQLVLGSLLGDASLQVVESKKIGKKYINKATRGRVRFRHGPKQFNYLMWKHKILGPHAGTAPSLKPSAGYTKTTASFSTSCDFYDVIEPTIINGKKSPNPVWLSKVGAMGLAVWYMDNGGISNQSARFNTHGFDLAANNLLAGWLRSTWGLECEVKPTVKNDQTLYYIQLGRESTRLLMRLISRYIPPCMRHKLIKYVPHEPQTGYALRNPHRKLDLERSNTPLLDLQVAVQETDWEGYDSTVETQVCREVSESVIRSIEPYKETVTYDLEVEDNHNYFAGNTLVSNCHNIESQLMDFVSLSISDAHLQQHGIVLPKLETPEEYAVFFEDSKLHEALLKVYNDANEQDQIWLADEISRTLKKYKMFLDHIQTEGSVWVSEYESSQSGHNKVTLKPVYVHNMASELLFQYAHRVVLMSATILDVDVICKSLGIPREEVAAVRLKNRFPVKNRPIHIRPVAKMTGGAEGMKKWGPALVEGVNQVADEYPDKRGIIHTHNFSIAKLLRENCDPGVKRRFLFQDEFNNDKKAMLAAHAKSPDSILVAPAMHEGIDLHGDLSRFQVICKVPYANFYDNPQLAMRVEADWKYYIWITALKLVQSYGRSVRSDTDYADTYILDESINKFIRDAKNMLPDWFLEAIKYE